MSKSEFITTLPFRLAFPEVFKPKAFQEGQPAKYSVTMLYPKDGSLLIPSMPGNGIMQLRKLAFDAAVAKWGEDRAKWPVAIRALDFKTYVSPNGKDGWPIRDGDMVEWDGFGGMLFVRASSKYPPAVYDRNVHLVTDEEDVCGGRICVAQINAYAYDDARNKGVTFGLNGLQILKDDGVVYGYRANVEGAFNAFDDGESAFDATGTDDAW